MNLKRFVPLTNKLPLLCFLRKESAKIANGHSCPRVSRNLNLVSSSYLCAMSNSAISNIEANTASPDSDACVMLRAAALKHPPVGPWPLLPESPHPLRQRNHTSACPWLTCSHVGCGIVIGFVLLNMTYFMLINSHIARFKVRDLSLLVTISSL